MISRMMLAATPIALCATAQADLITWTGAAGNSEFSTATNWSPARVPGINDTAFIGSGSGSVRVSSTLGVGAIICYRPFIINAGMSLYGDSSFFENLTINSPFYFGNSFNTLRCYRTVNWNSGPLEPTITSAQPTIELQPGAIFNSSGANVLGLNLAALQDSTINIGSIGLYADNHGGSLIVLSVQPGATMNVNSSGTFFSRDPNGFAIVNYGTMNVRGSNVTFNQDTYFYSSGLLHVEGNTTIMQPAFLGPGRHQINIGQIEVINASLNFPNDRSISSIGPQCWLTLSGPNAQVSSLYALEANYGRIYVNNGATAAVGNNSFINGGLNRMYNGGIIDVGVGSRLHSYGTFEIGGNGAMASHTTGPGVAGQFSADLFMTGSCVLRMITDNGYRPQLGDRFPVGFVSANSWYYGSNIYFHHLIVDSIPATLAPAANQPYHAIEVLVTCAADFNGDGFLDGFDYDDFVACFEGDGCPNGRLADFNNDGFVDGFDYDDFIASFEYGCL